MHPINWACPPCPLFLNLSSSGMIGQWLIHNNLVQIQLFGADHLFPASLESHSFRCILPSTNTKGQGSKLSELSIDVFLFPVFFKMFFELLVVLSWFSIFNFIMHLNAGAYVMNLPSKTQEPWNSLPSLTGYGTSCYKNKFSYMVLNCVFSTLSTGNSCIKGSTGSSKI